MTFLGSMRSEKTEKQQQMEDNELKTKVGDTTRTTRQQATLLEILLIIHVRVYIAVVHDHNFYYLFFIYKNLQLYVHDMCERDKHT